MVRSRAGPRRAAVLIATAAITWLHAAGIAGATFSSAPAAPAMSVSTATLVAPTGLTAVRGACVPAVSRQVNLSWTASTGSADGYEVFRSTTSGGPYSSLGTVLSPLTTYIDTSPAASTTYYYVVQTTKGAWRSGNSSQASVTTPNLACL